MSDDVVERVARAICIVHGTDPDSHSREQRHAVEIDGVTNIVTDHMGPLWKMWASDANAALSALRPGDELPGGLVVVERPRAWDDPGICPECGEPWEIVRPGKSQPTCDCQDKCPECGTMRRYFGVGEIAPRRGGFLCPKCDAATPD